MTNKNLFKEAIADAKAVREAALANAKVALEEALTPKLQSMLAAKLNEMSDYEEEGLKEYGMEHPDRDMDGDGDIDAEDVKMMKEDELEEDFDLSEILAELNEAKEEDEEEEEEAEESEESEEKVSSMSIEDLKALIKDIVGQEIEAEEAEGPEAESEEEAGEEAIGGEEMPAGEESDEIDLEELLAELDAMGEAKDEEMEEGLGSLLKKGARTVGSALDSMTHGGSVADFNACKEQMPNATTAELKACVEKRAPGSITATPYEPGAAFGARAVKKESEEMQEAISVINTLRNELNEVNLLNAKLLYVNKIFKAKNLTESQKLTVIASFDKATTAKEAKVVFESLSTNLNASPAKKAIKESLGFASKAAGIAPNKVIVESNDIITRMQKLANIIK